MSMSQDPCQVTLTQAISRSTLPILQPAWVLFNIYFLLAPVLLFYLSLSDRFVSISNACKFNSGRD